VRNFVHVLGEGAVMKITTTIEVPDSAFNSVVQEIISKEGRMAREEAAKLAHLSVSRFTAEFKRIYGITFREFQIRVRLAIAKQLLVGTRLRVSEISDRLNYSDLGKFEKMFKRCLKVSPSAYRARHQIESSSSAGIPGFPTG
jgi:AraC-like DNA-binding protein